MADWAQIIGWTLTGSLATAVVEAIRQGLRDRAIARGKKADDLERLRREAELIRDEVHRLRRLAYDLGATREQVGELPDTDPD